MKKIACMMALVLLLAAVPAGAAEPGLPVRVGRRSGVTDITMVYAVDTRLASNCTVTLVPQEQVYQQENVKGDRIYIAMASAGEIDTSAPLAWITADLAEGASITETIRLESLIINGKPVSRNLAASGFQAVPEGERLTVSGSLWDDFGGSCTAYLAVYDRTGRMLDCRLYPVELQPRTEQRFSESIEDCGEASAAKLFFLSGGSPAPVTDSVEMTVRK